jgi:large subunit ribosomal protein L4
MEKNVFSVDNKELRSVELSDDVFAADVSEGAIYYAICAELNNRRVGTASKKTRAEVRGSTAKPWRQKGTGRARAGRRRSPLWVGGGVVFAPKPRDFTTKVPKKMKRRAVTSILTMKAAGDSLVVVENFSIESGKTKELAAILKAVTGEVKTLLVMPENDGMLKRAGRNIPFLRYATYNSLSAHDLYYSEKLLIMEGSVEKLNEFYGNSAKKEAEA